MKTNYRRMFAMLVLSLLFSVTAARAATSEAHDVALSKKAIALTKVACNIYPAMTDLDRCVDKVLHAVLTGRGMKTEGQDALIIELKNTFADRYPNFSSNSGRISPEEHRQNILYARMLDVIDASCAIEPVLTDLDLCMDRAFHSILSSRDPHSGYMNKEEFKNFGEQVSGELQGIGTEIGQTEDNEVGVIRVIPGSPAERAGVKDGDRIIAITNKGERELTSSFKTIDEAVRKIRGEPNTEVTLEILRGAKNELITITIVRGVVIIDMVRTEILTSPTDPSIKFAYVQLLQFGGNLRKKMVTAVNDVLSREQVSGIIFDVRNNPGGLLREVYEAVDAVLDSPDPLVSVRTNGGIHAYGTAPDESTPQPQPGDVTGGLPMGVLINGRSASASEIFAGDLKELERAVIIGTGTWRKGTIQTVGPSRMYPYDGSAVRVTEAEYLLGSPTKWVAVQCVGVDPDIFYDPVFTTKPMKEIHECDLPGAVLSGGARSAGNLAKAPLRERNPALYRAGEHMLAAIKVFDQKVFTKNEEARRRLKIKEPKNELQEEK